jgi:hypothetical protein
VIRDETKAPHPAAATFDPNTETTVAMQNETKKRFMGTL